MEDLERHLASHGLFLGAGGAPSWVVQFQAARVDGELPARLLAAYVHEGTLVFESVPRVLPSAPRVTARPLRLMRRGMTTSPGR